MKSLQSKKLLSEYFSKYQDSFIQTINERKNNGIGHNNIYDGLKLLDYVKSLNFDNIFANKFGEEWAITPKDLVNYKKVMKSLFRYGIRLNTTILRKSSKFNHDIIKRVL